MSGLRDRGIDLLGARNAALRQLVLDMPPALAAAALGYSPETAEYHAAAGQPWAQYAALAEPVEDKAHPSGLSQIQALLSSVASAERCRSSSVAVTAGIGVCWLRSRGWGRSRCRSRSQLQPPLRCSVGMSV